MSVIEEDNPDMRKTFVELMAEYKKLESEMKDEEIKKLYKKPFNSTEKQEERIK